MRVIGLTGGIAAGKSAVAKRFKELGAVIVDADAIAREVVEPGTPGLVSIERAFGSSVIDADGRLNRAALGAIVFSNAEALATLNGITHPAIGRRTDELFEQAGAEDPDAIVVYDVPLLLEGTGSRERFEQIVVVEAEPDTRIERMITLRGMSRDEAEKRINAQGSNEARRAIADRVIDSNGSLPDTLRQVDEYWADFIAS